MCAALARNEPNRLEQTIDLRRLSIRQRKYFVCAPDYRELKQKPSARATVARPGTAINIVIIEILSNSILEPVCVCV